MSEISDMLKEYAENITGKSYTELVYLTDFEDDKNVLGKKVSHLDVDYRRLARGNPLFVDESRMITREEIDEGWKNMENIWKKKK